MNDISKKQSKKALMQAYNAIAKEYGGYRRKAWPEILEFTKSLKGKWILDLGSGNCCTSRHVLDNGNKLIALDFSVEALRRCPAEALKVCGDVTRLPIKKKFDAILAISLLHHLSSVEDRENCLGEIKRILRGKCLLSVWHGKPGDRLVKWGKYKRYYHFFSKQELENLIKKYFKKYKINIGGTEYKNYFVTISSSKH